MPVVAVRECVRRLTAGDVGLLHRIEESTYVLRDPPSPEEVRRLERDLGTLASYQNALARHEKHWDNRRRAQESALAAVTDVSQSVF
jgi:hypothetical protein